MMWAFLYVAGLIVTWVGLIRVTKKHVPAHDVPDEIATVWLCLLAAAVWPLTGTIAVVWHLTFNSEEK
ncbi:hypothetical protein RHRU231_450137 [Rhodococcus ruber]|uniref:Uncharacterized protein n=1 Tax=Rhodococcus ruber TaxID=1830 RepID=A0A098BL57_9NOCA|nr:hypothetical protein RHRU231_450137 [Rhodococcus ruber]